MPVLTDQQRKFYENTLQVTRQEIAVMTATSGRTAAAHSGAMPNRGR